MASNRDPRKDYRINRRGRKVTSSSNRSARSKKSTVPKPTSSSTRSSTKGSSSRVTTGQGGSRARVKVKPKSTGLIGTRNTPATKSTYSGPPRTKQPTLSRVSRQLRTAGAAATIANPRSDLPAKALAVGSIVKGIYDSRKKKGSKTKTKPTPGMAKGAVAKAKSDAKKTNRQSKAASFDRAFAAARKAGKSTFTWRGKKYNTKTK